MKIGIIADTHDHVRNIGEALARFGERGVEVVLHAGDVVAPFAAKALARFDGPVRAVFGNNDGERNGLSRVLDITSPPRELELGGRRIVMAHEPGEIPEELARSADVIVTAHSHEPAIVSPDGAEHGRELTQSAGGGRGPLRINPGEAGGWLTERASCIVFDAVTLEAELVELGGP